MALSREQAATRYLESSIGAGATGLPAEQREARESLMANLERKHPGTRRRAIAGTRRHFDRPLTSGEREHQAELRRKEGLSMGDVDRIGSEELDAGSSPGSGSSTSNRSGRRRGPPSAGASRAVRRATRAASSASGGRGLFTYVLGIGLVLVLVYLFVKAKPAGGFSGPQIFTGLVGLVTGALTNFLGTKDPISSAEAKLGAAPLATPAPFGGSSAPTAGPTPTGLLSALFPKGTTYAVSRTDAGKDFSNIGGAIGALEAGTITAVHNYSGFGMTIFQELSQPIAGKRYAYYALETGGASKVRPGQAVNAGEPLASGTGGVIEVGLSSRPDVSGIEQGGRQESGGTPAGLAFASALGFH